MNITTLIRQHPLLLADLKNLGLTHRQLNTLALIVGEQLGGNANYNLCYIFAALTTREFVAAVDVQALATHLNTSPALAESAVLMLAPWIGRFEIDACEAG